MPQVTVYVREDDIEQWKAIEKKSEFIHDALIMAKLPPEVLKSHVPKIPGLAKSENIKQNPDGTLSPAVIGKPTSFTTDPLPPPPFAPYTAARLKVKPDPKEYTFPPSAASNVIKTPEEAKKVVETPKFIEKKYSARKPGSKERHVDL